MQVHIIVGKTLLLNETLKDFVAFVLQNKSQTGQDGNSNVTSTNNTQCDINRQHTMSCQQTSPNAMPIENTISKRKATHMSHQQATHMSHQQKQTCHTH